MLQKLLDKTFWKFLMVGVVNTLFGSAIMFAFYNWLHLSYWVSSAANYILGSILSFFLNKRFTFENKSKSPMVALRFALNIAVCYLVAYGVAKPLMRALLQGASQSVQENVAMLTGMCLFVGLNYLGQRFFAFRKEEEG